MAFVINYIFVLLIASTDMIQIKVLNFVFHFFNAFEKQTSSLLHPTKHHREEKAKENFLSHLSFVGFLLMFLFLKNQRNLLRACARCWC